MITWLLLAMMMQQGGTLPQDQAAPLYSPSVRNICEESMSYGGETVAMKDIFEKCGRSKPESMDVPAMSDHADLRNMTHRACRDLQIEKALDWAASDYGVKPTITFIHNGDESGLGTCRYAYFTCADKSRTLLTAEDGTRHCVKFSFTPSLP